jgi:hypothetical protein
MPFMAYLHARHDTLQWQARPPKNQLMDVFHRALRSVVTEDMPGVPIRESPRLVDPRGEVPLCSWCGNGYFIVFNERNRSLVLFCRQT